jgi:hypothetical protein
MDLRNTKMWKHGDITKKRRFKYSIVGYSGYINNSPNKANEMCNLNMLMCVVVKQKHNNRDCYRITVMSVNNMQITSNM